MPALRITKETMPRGREVRWSEATLRDIGRRRRGAKQRWATSIPLQFINNPIHHRQKIFKSCLLRQQTHHDTRSSRNHVRGQIHTIDLVESCKKLYSLRFLFKRDATHQILKLDFQSSVTPNGARGDASDYHNH